MSGFDDIWAAAPNLPDFPWFGPVPKETCPRTKQSHTCVLWYTERVGGLGRTSAPQSGAEAVQYRYLHD
jgi:hypothetical protein